MTKVFEELTEQQNDIVNFAINRPWTTPIFKQKYFVGGSELTPYARLRQYLTEVNSRTDVGEQIEYELTRCELEVELLEEEDASCETSSALKLNKLAKQDKIKDIVKYKRRISALNAERRQFLQLIQEILDSEAGTLPDGRSLMAAFEDPELENQLEAEYWTIRLAKQAAMAIIAYGRIDVGNLDSIAMMPRQQQIECLKLATDYSVQIEDGMMQLKQDSIKRLRSDGELQLETDINSPTRLAFTEDIK